MHSSIARCRHGRSHDKRISGIPKYHAPATSPANQTVGFVHDIERNVACFQTSRLESFSKRTHIGHVAISNDRARYSAPGDSQLRTTAPPLNTLVPYAVRAAHSCQPVSRNTLKLKNEITVSRTWPFPAFLHGSRITDHGSRIDPPRPYWCYSSTTRITCQCHNVVLLVRGCPGICNEDGARLLPGGVDAT